MGVGALGGDVADEIRTLLATVSALQPVGEFFPNPVFGGLGPIKGSDGDWIAGDTLVELKCTVRPVKREYVVQLLCYAALSRLPHNKSRIPELRSTGIEVAEAVRDCYGYHRGLAGGIRGPTGYRVT